MCLESLFKHLVKRVRHYSVFSLIREIIKMIMFICFLNKRRFFAKKELGFVLYKEAARLTCSRMGVCKKVTTLG